MSEQIGQESTLLAERYRLVDLLGSGGMGSVYRAYDTKMDREVAIKRLKAAKRLAQEATAMAALTHPNIVKIHSIERDEQDFPFLVLEYVSGKTLKTIIKESGALDSGTCKKIALQALDALQHAHAAGVVHRDLKPANLMLDDKGNLKILDFGVAKLLGMDEQRVTQTGEIVGTPDYISPEQCNNGTISPATDIYSLGCCLYFCLTSNPPFTGDSMMEVLIKQLSEQPTFRQIPDAHFAGVIAKSMAKDPAGRFADAAEMAAALRSKTGIKAPERKPTKKKHRRNLLPYVVTVASALLLSLILVPPLLRPKPKPQEIDLTSVRGEWKFLREVGPRLSHGELRVQDRETLLSIREAVYANNEPQLTHEYEATTAWECYRSHDYQNFLEHGRALLLADSKIGAFDLTMLIDQVDYLERQHRLEQALQLLKWERQNLIHSTANPLSLRIVDYQLLWFAEMHALQNEVDDAEARLKGPDAEVADMDLLLNARRALSFKDTIEWQPSIFFLSAPRSHREPGFRAYATVTEGSALALKGDKVSAVARYNRALREAKAALKRKDISPMQREFCQRSIDDANAALEDSTPAYSTSTHKNKGGDGKAAAP